MPVEALPFEGAASGAWSGDFLRGGNAFSVAAEKPLEVDLEVKSGSRPRPLSATIARRVAEDQTVPVDGL